MFTTYQNFYTYSQTILWLAYGTAIAVAFLVVALGIYAHITNRGSYSIKFSTILRTTRDASLSEKIMPEDADGKNPLPDYIAKTEILLPDDFSGHEKDKVLDRRREHPSEITEEPRMMAL